MKKIIKKMTMSLLLLSPILIGAGKITHGVGSQTDETNRQNDWTSEQTMIEEHVSDPGESQQLDVSDTEKNMATSQTEEVTEDQVLSIENQKTADEEATSESTTVSENEEIIDSQENHEKETKETKLNQQWGSSDWTFDENIGVLTIESGTLSGYVNAPWNRQDEHQVQPSTIKKIIIAGTVVAPKNSAYLFSQGSGEGLTELQEIVGLEKIDTAQVTSFYGVFSNAKNLTHLNGIEEWQTGNVTNMEQLFYRMTNLTSLNLNKWDTSKVTNLYNTFAYDGNLEKLEVAHWDTTQVETMSGTFYGTGKLQVLDIGQWRTPKLTKLYNTFAYAKSIKTLDVSQWDTHQVTTMGGTFYDMESLETLDISQWETSEVTSMLNMFNSDRKLTSLDMSQWDTKKVTDMSGMFSGATNLVELKGIETFDTSQVTSMKEMFYKMTSLKSLNLNEWDTSNVTSLYNTFAYDKNLENLDVTEWQTGNVTTLAGTFYSLENLSELEISSWQTNQVKSLLNTFGYSAKLKKLPVGKWQTNLVTDMSGAFSNLTELNSLDLSHWRTDQVSVMKDMFSATPLGEITLGEGFKFKENAGISAPAPLKDGEDLTGKWQRSDGESKSYSPADFMNLFGTDDLKSGTYVGEKAIPQAMVNVDFKVTPKTETLEERPTVGEPVEVMIQFTNKGTAKSLAEDLRLTHFETQFESTTGKASLTYLDKAGQVINEKDLSVGELVTGYQFDSLGRNEHIQITYDGVAWNNSDHSLKEADQLALTYFDGVAKTTARYAETIPVKSGHLGFTSIPKNLAFKTKTLGVSLTGQFIDRQEADWEMTLEDYRGTYEGTASENSAPDRQDWQIYVTAAPFKDNVGNELSPNILSIAFIKDDQVTELGTDASVIESHSVENEHPKENHLHTVSWPERGGLKAHVNQRNGLKSNTTYQSQLEFELRMEP